MPEGGSKGVRECQRLFVANETDDVRRTRPFAKPRDKNVACVQALLRNGVIVWPADPAGSPQVFAVANVSVEKECVVAIE